MKSRAVIFDLDGTVLDNEDEYGASFNKVLQSLGAKVKEKYPQIGGIGVKENWPQLFKKYNIKTKKSIEELAGKTQEAYLAQLDKVTLKPGLEEFIKKLKKDGTQIALATSNGWWIVEAVFDRLNLDRFFDVVTTAEEVTHTKPDPDLFLLTAQKLGVKPKECLVIEDAASGIEAAHRAGMKVIGLARDKAHGKTLKGADKGINSYNQLLQDD
jgi:HAD superfamily hydrolase (TIGR01509 family)